VEQRHIDAGRRLGASYLTKPFSANALTKTVEKLCRRELAVAPAGW
jgi:DNA-binding response OmpR family regulator